MKLHANAPLGPKGRAIMVRRVRRGGSLADGGGRGRRSQRAALPRKWVRRYRAEGEVGLLDRSSAPKRGRQPHPMSIGSKRSRPCVGCG